MPGAHTRISVQPDAELPAVMRRGEATDRIIAALYTPATPQQLEQLQVRRRVCVRAQGVGRRACCATLLTPLCCAPAAAAIAQAQLGPAAVRELPVPLLRDHAAALLREAAGSAGDEME